MLPMIHYFFFESCANHRDLHSFPTRRSSDLTQASTQRRARERSVAIQTLLLVRKSKSSSVKSKTAEACGSAGMPRSEERFSRNAETDLVCRLLLEKKKNEASDKPRAIKHART